MNFIFKLKSVWFQLNCSDKVISMQLLMGSGVSCSIYFKDIEFRMDLSFLLISIFNFADIVLLTGIFNFDEFLFVPMELGIVGQLKAM